MMPSPAAAAAGLRDTDTDAGMGEAVRRVCAMGFPGPAARFALEAYSTFEEAVAFLLDGGDYDDVASMATPVGAGTAPPRPGASPVTGAVHTEAATVRGQDSGDGVIGTAPLRLGVPSAPPAEPDSVPAADVSSAADAASSDRNWRLNPVRQRGGWRARRKMVQHALKRAKAAGDADAIAVAERQLKAADCRPAKQKTTERAAVESSSGPGRRSRKHGRASREATEKKRRKRAEKGEVRQLVRAVRHMTRAPGGQGRPASALSRGGDVARRGSSRGGAQRGDVAGRGARRGRGRGGGRPARPRDLDRAIDRTFREQDRLQFRQSALMWQQELERQRRCQQSPVRTSPAMQDTEVQGSGGGGGFAGCRVQAVAAETAVPAATVAANLADDSSDDGWNWARYGNCR